MLGVLAGDRYCNTDEELERAAAVAGAAARRDQG
jgi:hypothetical protein